MIKDLFTGSLGKLNNHGGSRIYTTPNTILVPPEYEVDIGEHGDWGWCCGHVAANNFKEQKNAEQK